MNRLRWLLGRPRSAWHSLMRLNVEEAPGLGPAADVISEIGRDLFRALMIFAWGYFAFKIGTGLVHHYHLFGFLWGQ